MKGPKKPARKAEGLSDAIKSLQHLLDDVGTPQSTSGQGPFDDTGEFELTGAIKALGGDDDTPAIDSHFDMNIPPALPGEDTNETDEIPVLSESIVAGGIPVLMEAVKLPEGKNIDLAAIVDEQNDSDIAPALLDAVEAAADAVQIILRRYNHEPLSPQARQQLELLVREYLENELNNDSE